MSTAEDPYGTHKRFAFCQNLIREVRPGLVLDIGCGTGIQLTRLLAEAFPEIQFVGIDPDEGSIGYAKSLPAVANLQFGGTELMNRYAQADIIIASEVVEHVEEPDRFLADLRGRLPDAGRMIVTLPNGYGPFEAVTTVESVFRILRIYRAMRRIKRWLLHQPAPELTASQNSLAVSPHLSFFSFGGILRLFQAAGFRIVRYQPRTFLCGFGIDKILSRFGLCDWNAGVADRLPPWCNSAWMFVLAKAGKAGGTPFRRGALSRLRRKLNEACARLI